MSVGHTGPVGSQVETCGLLFYRVMMGLHRARRWLFLVLSQAGSWHMPYGWRAPIGHMQTPAQGVRESQPTSELSNSADFKE